MGNFLGNFYPTDGCIDYDSLWWFRLVLPPSLAPIQVVIVPIFKGEEQLQQIDEVAYEIQAKLKAKGISVKYDNHTENKPGWKFAEYELKGVPVRIALGARDL